MRASMTCPITVPPGIAAKALDLSFPQRVLSAHCNGTSKTIIHVWNSFVIHASPLCERTVHLRRLS